MSFTAVTAPAVGAAIQDAAFSVGQIVRLKSGSPNLTVELVSSEGEIYVVFWNGVAFCTEHFVAGLLERAEKPGSIVVLPQNTPALTWWDRWWL